MQVHWCSHTQVIWIEIDESLEQEPLVSLLGRILYRIKMLSDQQPLDSLSLSYVLPLLTRVLYDGKAVAIKNASKVAVTSEFVEEDPEEEQLLLAIEIISAHAESFEDDKIPRTSILEVLISLMKLPSKAKLSKECFCHCVNTLLLIFVRVICNCCWVV